MYDKLDFIQEKYQELSLKVSDPDVIADQANWQKYAKELGEIEPIVQKYVEYKSAVDGIKEAKEILGDNSSDEEMRELAKMELSDLEDKVEVYTEELRILLIPKDLSLCLAQMLIILKANMAPKLTLLNLHWQTGSGQSSFILS